MRSMKSRRLWEIPIFSHSCCRLSYWALKEVRKSTCKRGQHVGMAKPSLNALHLLPKMALQPQSTVPCVYTTVITLVTSLSSATQGITVPGTPGTAFKWLASSRNGLSFLLAHTCEHSSHLCKQTCTAGRQNIQAELEDSLC